VREFFLLETGLAGNIAKFSFDLKSLTKVEGRRIEVSTEVTMLVWSGSLRRGLLGGLEGLSLSPIKCLEQESMCFCASIKRPTLSHSHQLNKEDGPSARPRRLFHGFRAGSAVSWLACFPTQIVMLNKKAAVPTNSSNQTKYSVSGGRIWVYQIHHNHTISKLAYRHSVGSNDPSNLH